MLGNGSAKSKGIEFLDSRRSCSWVGWYIRQPTFYLAKKKGPQKSVSLSRIYIHTHWEVKYSYCLHET